jgi:hypothetical protein
VVELSSRSGRRKHRPSAWRCAAPLKIASPFGEAAFHTTLRNRWDYDFVLANPNSELLQSAEFQS